MIYQVVPAIIFFLLTLSGVTMSQTLAELPPHLKHFPVNEEKTIIYSGSSPSESALPPILLAAMQQPDFIELPVVLTRDNVPLVFDDIYLHPKTNVAAIFPERNREDGNYYAIDFTLAEIEQLVYSDGTHSITTHPVSLDDVLAILPRIREITGASLQVLPVVKFPWFHTEEVFDISNAILKTLTAHAESADTLYYLKCYDPDELQRIEKLLLPGLPLQVRLIQGIDSENGRETMRNRRGRWQGYNYDWMFTRLGLRVLSGYAHGLILRNGERMSRQELQAYISDIQALNMKIFLETPPLQTAMADDYFRDMLVELNVDGLASNQPGNILEFINRNKASLSTIPENPGTDSPLPQQALEQNTGPEFAPHSQQEFIEDAALPPQPFDDVVAEPEEKKSPALSDPESLSERLRQIKGEE